jgi:DNA-binding NtrC family response regulator
MVEAGLFRPDLYYRLAGVEIHVPSLRSRREDIPLLVNHFLHTYGRSGLLTVSADALSALMAYEWPGNVRQLARVLERAIALATRSEVGLEDLPDGIGRVPSEQRTARSPHDRSLRAWSSVYVRDVLGRCGGNKRRACDVLGISYHTLQAHLAYGETPGRDGPAAVAERHAGNDGATVGPVRLGSQP